MCKADKIKMAEKDDDENKNLASVSGKFHGIFPRSLRKYREAKARLRYSRLQGRKQFHLKAWE